MGLNYCNTKTSNGYCKHGYPIHPFLPGILPGNLTTGCDRALFRNPTPEKTRTWQDQHLTLKYFDLVFLYVLIKNTVCNISHNRGTMIS